MYRTLFLVAGVLSLAALNSCQPLTDIANQQTLSAETTTESEEQELDPRYGRDVEAKVAALREVIDKESLALEKHPWAGTYYCGDGLGMNVMLHISPKGGFVYEWHGCMGVYDRNYGPVVEKDGLVTLVFTIPEAERGFHGIAREYIPIAWGKRHYLIPTEDIVGFCNDINECMEPRDGMHGSYLLKRGDEKIAVDDMPGIPKEFEYHILAEPIEAEVIAVEKTSEREGVGDIRFTDTLVAVKPSNEGQMFVGMDLHVVEPTDVHGTITIYEVGKESSKGIMTSMLKDEPAPQVGWHLSTKAWWRIKLDEVEK